MRLKKHIVLCILFCGINLFAGSITSENKILRAAVSDLNGDGKPDIALLTSQDGKTQLEIYYAGKGTVSGKADSIASTSDGGVNLTAGSLQGKTYLLVTAGKQKTDIFGPENQYRQPVTSASANQWVWHCSTGQLTHDNSLDIFHGACLRRFTPPDKISHGYFYGPQENNNGICEIYDLNGDGESDAAFTIRKKPGIRLYFAPFYGKLKIKPAELNEFAELKTPCMIQNMAFGDLNGDSRPDIAAATLSEYDIPSRKTYIFFQNSPVGFTDGASPDITIAGNGLPVIHRGNLYLANSYNGSIRVFASRNFSRPVKTVQTGLKNLNTFLLNNDCFIISGENAAGQSEVRWGKSIDELKTRTAIAAKTSFPHYMGAVYPAPQQAEYGNRWIPLKQVRIIPDGITADDLRIDFIKERIAELGGMVQTDSTPHPDETTVKLSLQKKSHPHGQAYYLTADADRKTIELTAFDNTGLTWAVGSFLQLTDRQNGGASVRAARIYDWPATPHRGYWSGESDFRKISKREWAKLHMLYKLDVMILIRPWNLIVQPGKWSTDWRKVHDRRYLADYQEMKKYFSDLGIEWCVSTHAIEGKAETKLNSASPGDFELICRQAEMAAANGGSFMFQYDDHRYPRHPQEISAFPNGGDADFEFIRKVTSKVWKKYPNTVFYFCPPMYWGPNAEPAYPDNRDDYLKRVSRLSEKIRFTWNGPSVCSTDIKPSDLEWAKKHYSRTPFILIFGGGPNIERWHFFTEPIAAWQKWYYKGMEKQIAGALLGTNQPQFLMLTLTFADYWHNPAAYDADRSIRQAFNSLIGSGSWEDACKITAELQKMNDYGYQVSPYFIRNRQKISGIIHTADTIFKRASAKNPELDKWTAYGHFIRIFRNALDKAGRVNSDIFSRNLNTIQADAEKETGFKAQRDILLSPYDFGGGAAPLFYSYRCAKRLATFIKGKKTRIAAMTASFNLKTEQLNGTYELVICGQDDDSPEKCPILIELNGNTVFQGANTFDRFGWNIRRFSIAAGLLKEGANSLVIRNLSDSGNISGPPFFILNYAILQKK